MEGKKLITYRQLNELITKGYGQWFYNYDNAVMGKNTLFIDKEVNENILIRPYGFDKLVRPTVDIYEEFMKRKAEEHQEENVIDYVGVSEKEKPTASEESSSTQGECIGVHRRTPQEIADFFDCYVAMDKDGMWCLYVEEPTIVTVIKDGWRLKNPRRDSFIFINDALLSKPNSIDWRTLYRPHREPIVMEEGEE